MSDVDRVRAGEAEARDDVEAEIAKHLCRVLVADSIERRQEPDPFGAELVQSGRSRVAPGGP